MVLLTVREEFYRPPRSCMSILGTFLDIMVYLGFSLFVPGTDIGSCAGLGSVENKPIL